MSVISLFYIEYNLKTIVKGKTKPSHFVLLAFLLFITCVIHPFGIVSSTFMISVIICHFYLNKDDFAKISRKEIIYFTSGCFI